MSLALMAPSRPIVSDETWPPTARPSLSTSRSRIPNGLGLSTFAWSVAPARAAQKALIARI